MDTDLRFLPASPVLPSVIESTGSAIGPAPPVEGGEFSALLTGQMLKAERQLFAAQALDGTGLQVLPLGSNIKLITSDGPLPDIASLAAFARTQGLDEAAVQALFADQNISASALDLTQPVSVQFGLRNTPEFPPGSLVSEQPTQTSSTPSRPGEMLVLAAELSPSSPALLMALGQSATGPVNVTPPGTETPSRVAPRTHSPPLVVAFGQSATGPVNVAPPGTETPSRVAPRTDSSHKEPTALKAAAELNPVNPAWLMPLNIAATQTSTEDMAHLKAASPLLVNSNMAFWMPLKASTWVDASKATYTSEVSSEMAIQDAMRLTIAPPIQAVTKRLSQMSGSSEQSTWATLLAGNTLQPTTLPAAKAWETLQLDIPDDLLMGLLNRPQESLAGVSLENSPGPRTGEAVFSTLPGSNQPAKSETFNLSAQIEQRFIHQQQLADKLGQALAQRLVEQMERGQWKIQMRLQPESLGRIEVELKMHAGGLDALFSAENPVTRELITQGSGKLKDSLAQTGMTVASVFVNSDQGRQSGGNSTPGNVFKPATSTVARRPNSVEDVVASVKSEPATTGGLNIWA